MSIDATVGGSSSDSYVTVATADSYHTTHLYSSTWTASTINNKERSLKMATRLLDERVTWTGTKNTNEQALRWPRASVTNNDSYSVPVTSIPAAIQNATAEFARHLIISDLTAQPEGKGIESLDAGAVSIKFSKTDTADVLPAIVQEMLRGWGTIHSRSKFGSVSVVRT